MFSSQPGKLGAVGRKTLVQRAISVLRRYGQDAHIYLPGVGMLNGLTAANYLDSAGTTAGTVDQPVGLVLDAAGSLGVELVTNGGPFTTTTGWQAVAAGNSISAVGGALRVTGNGTNYLQAGLTLPTVAGSNYVLTIVAKTGPTVSGNAIRVNLDATSFGSASITNGGATSAQPQFVFTATSALTYLVVRNNGAVAEYFEVASISVREVTGIHASQPTTASKPILRRGAVNLVSYSNDVANAYWTKNNMAAPVTGIADHLGGTTAQKIAANAVSTNHYLSPGAGTFPAANITCTYAVVAKMAEETVLGIGIAGGTAFSATFNLSNGTTVPNNVTSEIKAIGNGFYLCVMVGTPTAYANSPYISIRATQTTFVGDGASGLILSGIALFQGTYTAQQIQALGGIPLTTTAPASTALGPQYWAFDGSNDSLSLGGPLFQMADDHCVVAGARCDTATGDRTVFSTRSTVSGTPILSALDFTAGVPRAYWRDDAGVGVGITATAIATDCVLALRKVGNTKELFVNAVSKGTNSTALGVTTVTNAAIGVAPVSTPNSYMQGSIYPMASIKGAMTDAEFILINKLVANLSGVQI